MKKKKRKLQINQFLFRNRHSICGAIVFALLFVLLIPFAAFADSLPQSNVSDTTEYGGNGEFTLDGNLATHFGLSEPYTGLSYDNMISDYSGDSSHILRSVNTGFIQQQTAVSDYTAYYDVSTNYGCVVPVSVSAGGVTLSLNSGAHYMTTYSWNSATSQKFWTNYRFWSAGQIAYVEASSGTGLYVVSDQPIQYIFTRSMAYFDNVVTVGLGEWSTTSENGYYCFPLRDQPVYIPFTDMPIYFASSDGDTGFTNFTENDSDFTFEGNYDFNSLISDGIVENPSAPEEEEIEAKYHLNFKDVTSYGGDSIEHFYHNNDFTFPEYVINNANLYKLKFSYEVHYKTHNMSNEKVYTCTKDILMSTFLGQSKRFNSGSRITISIFSDDLISNGVSLTDDLKVTVNEVDNTSVSVADPNTIFDVIVQGFDNVDDFFFGYDSNTYKGLPNVVTRYLGTIDTMYVLGNVSLYVADNSNYESFSYKDKHDFLTGQDFVLSTENIIPPYTNENQLPTVWDDTMSQVNPNVGGLGSTVNNATATIQKGAIQVYTGGAGFQMPQQDWDKFGLLLGEMKNDLTTVSEDHGVMSTMKLVKNVTEGILPTSGNENTNKIWLLIYAGVAGSIVIALWNKAAHNH